ncbi:DUF3685 domain-containing protein [Synechococcus sp. RSCCF101]|nr:DUF3685 domain-containing protein [Synechococcus sp. RSCCF101]
MDLALRQLLTERFPGAVVCREPDGLPRHPDLVILSLASASDSDGLREQLERLQERWRPAPLLLHLDAAGRMGRDGLLALPVQGLLVAAEPEALVEAATTLLAGGRDVRLPASVGATSRSTAPRPQGSRPASTGLARRLLDSALQQIETDLALISRLLDPPPSSRLLRLLLEGRCRELLMARDWVRWLWAPMAMAWGADDPDAASTASGAEVTALAIRLPGRDAGSIWQSLRQRLEAASREELINNTGQLLALEGLHPGRRMDLLEALLEQLDGVLTRLRADGLRGEELELRWQALQGEVQDAALRRVAGAYVRLPREGALEPVAPRLLRPGRPVPDLSPWSPSLRMLGPLVRSEPLLVDGQLLPPDDPRALLHLESLVSDWMLRTAEGLSGEILAACGDWPELRRYLLARELLATRSLERLRNRLNNRDRWFGLIERPLQLYESRRDLLCLQAGAIQPLRLTEARDQELRQLRGLPLLVTLALEARDAIAPQLRALLRRVGDVLVVLLTQVIGRGIGLIGRGILQGMGRSLSRP